MPPSILAVNELARRPAPPPAPTTAPLYSSAASAVGVRWWLLGYLGEADRLLLTGKDLLAWTLPSLRGQSCFSYLPGLDLVLAWAASASSLSYSCPIACLTQSICRPPASPGVTPGGPGQSSPAFTPSPFRARTSGACTQCFCFLMAQQIMF